MNLYYLLHLQTNYSDPINKVRKDVIDKILIHLPKRETINELKMAAAMKTFKSKFDLNEAECAYLVYKWISQNIEYDCFGVNNYTEWHGEALTYKEGKGVCSGFSYIFRTLCRFLGLEAEFVAGYTRSSDISIPSAPDHAWNSVKIDSTYYLIDSTWGVEYAIMTHMKKFSMIFIFVQIQKYLFVHIYLLKLNGNYCLILLLMNNLIIRLLYWRHFF